MDGSGSKSLHFRISRISHSGTTMRYSNGRVRICDHRLHVIDVSTFPYTSLHDLECQLRSSLSQFNILDRWISHTRLAS